MRCLAGYLKLKGQGHAFTESPRLEKHLATNNALAREARVSNTPPPHIGDDVGEILQGFWM